MRTACVTLMSRPKTTRNTPRRVSAAVSLHEQSPPPDRWTAPRDAAATVARRHLSLPAPGERIVVVAAPLGFGKTTLVASWFREGSLANGASAWLALDAAWRDPAHFERSLLAALDRPTPAGGSGTFSAMVTPETSALAVLDAIRRDPKPRTLFLDDVHELCGAASLDTLNRLLHATPDHVRWVLTTRDAANLNLASLTARGRVRWITQHELRFGADEVLELSRRLKRPRDTAAVQRLLGLTEGWPALVQLTLAGGDASPVAGTDLLVNDFIHQRFIKGLPAERQEALFTMAALGEFTPRLLEQLGVLRAREALAEAGTLGIAQARARVDDEVLYALHPLLAESALARLAGDGRGANQLRREAAHWWHAHGDPYRAIRLALAGGDAAQARAYLRGYARQLVQAEGRHETYLELLAQIEGRDSSADALLQWFAAWALVFLRRWVEAEGRLARAEREAGPDSVPLAHAGLSVRAVMAALRDDADAAQIHALRWLEQASDEEPFHRGAVFSVLGFAHKCHSRFAQAEQALREAQFAFERARLPYGLMWVRVVSAVALLKAGRHRDARAEIAAALPADPAADRTGLVAMLRAMHALLLYERGLLTEATSEAEAALPLLPHQGVVDAMVAGYVAAARLQAARGDLSAALDAAAEGERIGSARGFVRLQLTMAAERALLLLHAGDADGAWRIAADVGLQPESARSALHLDKAERLWARLDLAYGRVEAALRWADAGHARARANGQNYKQAEMQMLRARALHAAGNEPAATRAMMDSLALAAAHGYQRLYVDEGPALVPLLRAAIAPGSPGAGTSAANHAGQIVRALEPSASSAGAPAADDARASEREMEILILLAEGMSNNDVAMRLVLTEGTVKWHLHNLYAKLGVRNRTGALREARARGWLHA